MVRCYLASWLNSIILGKCIYISSTECFSNFFPLLFYTLLHCSNFIFFQTHLSPQKLKYYMYTINLVMYYMFSIYLYFIHKKSKILSPRTILLGVMLPSLRMHALQFQHEHSNYSGSAEYHYSFRVLVPAYNSKN